VINNVDHKSFHFAIIEAGQFGPRNLSVRRNDFNIRKIACLAGRRSSGMEVFKVRIPKRIQCDVLRQSLEEFRVFFEAFRLSSIHCGLPALNDATILYPARRKRRQRLLEPTLDKHLAEKGDTNCIFRQFLRLVPHRKLNSIEEILKDYSAPQFQG
jgi:hypothetical protein